MKIQNIEIFISFDGPAGWVARVLFEGKAIFSSNPSMSISEAAERAQSAIIMKLTGYV